jgi:hypothetical protein
MSVSVSGDGQITAVVSSGTGNSVSVNNSVASPVGNVFVSAGIAPTFTVSGGIATQIAVSGPTMQVAILNVSVSPGIGPTVVVDGTSTSIIGTAGINPFIAGKNITVTTTGGGITIIGADPPVTKVQGRTGDVTLSLIDLTAAPLVHTHSTTSITGLTSAIKTFANVLSVSGRTGAVTITTTDVVGLTASIQKFGNVLSVQGRTGNVVLTLLDITAAAAAHQHVAADITDFQASVEAYAQVKSVNGQTGDVTLDANSVGAAPASHQHASTDITDFHDAVLALAAVKSVNGQTGDVTLDAAAVGAASATHQHVVADITDFSSSLLVTSVAGKTGNVVVSAADVTAVESINGFAGVVTLQGSGGASISTASPAIVTIQSVVPWGKVPASQESGGEDGDVACDEDFFYLKLAGKGWKRSSLNAVWNDPYFSNVELLLHFEGSLSDSSSRARTATNVGTPSVSTIWPRFGSYAALFAYGTSWRLSYAADSAWDMGDGDFTAECWVKFNASGSDYSPAIPLVGTDSWKLGVNGTNPWGNRGIVFEGTSTTGTQYSFSGGNYPTDGYGYAYSHCHVALVRRGSIMRIFVDGVEAGSTVVGSASFSSSGSSPLRIGGDSTGSIYCFVDELRITKGIGRYYKPFYVPGAPFPDA